MDKAGEVALMYAGNCTEEMLVRIRLTTFGESILGSLFSCLKYYILSFEISDFYILSIET